MSAVLSPCEKYRYRLEREVSPGGIVFAYFGVNPSTAGVVINDSTVRKWIGFTRENGGKKFIVGNAFGYRSVNVSDLAKSTDPVGPDNDKHIEQIIHDADILVPCWGNSDKVPNRLRFRFGMVKEMLLESGKPVMTFGLTRSGDPKHPLMLGYKTPLVQFGAATKC